MVEYHVHLTACRQIAKGTMAFHFEKPVGFSHKPGQAIMLILPGHQTDSRSSDTRHTFSIVTAPEEDELVVATRISESVFKRALCALPIGTEVQINGPFGSFTLPKNTERAGVLIAGGIGITPFMSMLRHAAKQLTPQSLILLYSNHHPEEAAFLEELQQLEQQNQRFQLIATMTDMAHSTQPWDGATRNIDTDWIKQIVTGLDNPVFYVSGPPALVEAMRQTLTMSGIDEDSVRSETFYGY
ncbi:FAD-dependent oxidoreductase [Citrobacter sp. Awk 4]|uniref:FAD-dependent oxidoreductase n=1 Tax=Citrobacter sp. Awk 4 TaxID=2963955 RepID=UPI0023043CD8|nr:FAD-dependent oxidoreductase [Citrobacter sp. Awk 4]MDA8480987.1 FAD-dependent oxidoreductase [Citrobacter sp. Awk 4]